MCAAKACNSSFFLELTCTIKYSKWRHRYHYRSCTQKHTNIYIIHYRQIIPFWQNIKQIFGLSGDFLPTTKFLWFILNTMMKFISIKFQIYCSNTRKNGMHDTLSLRNCVHDRESSCCWAIMIWFIGIATIMEWKVHSNRVSTSTVYWFYVRHNSRASLKFNFIFVCI